VRKKRMARKRSKKVGSKRTLKERDKWLRGRGGSGRVKKNSKRKPKRGRTTKGQKAGDSGGGNLKPHGSYPLMRTWVKGENKKIGNVEGSTTILKGTSGKKKRNSDWEDRKPSPGGGGTSSSLSFLGGRGENQKLRKDSKAKGAESPIGKGRTWGGALSKTKWRKMIKMEEI